jgi:hypothetical protein
MPENSQRDFKKVLEKFGLKLVGGKITELDDTAGPATTATNATAANIPATPKKGKANGTATATANGKTPSKDPTSNKKRKLAEVKDEREVKDEGEGEGSEAKESQGSDGEDVKAE